MNHKALLISLVIVISSVVVATGLYFGLGVGEDAPADTPTASGPTKSTPSPVSDTHSTSPNAGNRLREQTRGTDSTTLTERSTEATTKASTPAPLATQSGGVDQTATLKPQVSASPVAPRSAATETVQPTPKAGPESSQPSVAVTSENTAGAVDPPATTPQPTTAGGKVTETATEHHPVPAAPKRPNSGESTGAKGGTETTSVPLASKDVKGKGDGSEADDEYEDSGDEGESPDIKFTDEQLKNPKTVDLNKLTLNAALGSTYKVEDVTVTVEKSADTLNDGFNEYKHKFNYPVKLTNGDTTPITQSNDCPIGKLYVRVKDSDRTPLMVKVPKKREGSVHKLLQYVYLSNEGDNTWVSTESDFHNLNTKLGEIYNKLKTHIPPLNK